MPNVGGGVEKHCHKFLVEMLIGFVFFYVNWF